MNQWKKKDHPGKDLWLCPLIKHSWFFHAYIFGIYLFLLIHIASSLLLTLAALNWNYCSHIRILVGFLPLLTLTHASHCCHGLSLTPRPPSMNHYWPGPGQNVQVKAESFIPDPSSPWPSSPSAFSWWYHLFQADHYLLEHSGMWTWKSSHHLFSVPPLYQALCTTCATTQNMIPVLLSLNYSWGNRWNNCNTISIYY